MIDHDVLLAPEVAVLLRMCVKTIYRLAEAGMIPGKRIGRSWRFSRSDIMEFISKGEAPAPSNNGDKNET